MGQRGLQPQPDDPLEVALECTCASACPCRDHPHHHHLTAENISPLEKQDKATAVSFLIPPPLWGTRGGCPLTGGSPQPPLSVPRPTSSLLPRTGSGDGWGYSSHLTRDEINT